MGNLLVSPLVYHPCLPTLTAASSYGPQGSIILFGFLLTSVNNGAIPLSWPNWGGINDTGFAIQNVLLPELILRLVMEDMSLDEQNAKEVMKESLEYGKIRSRVVDP